VYRNRKKTVNAVVYSTNTGKLQVTAWDVECLHREEGINGFGCHYLILQNGDVESHTTLETLRQREAMGNVDPMYNHNSIFIQVVGSDGNYTEAQKASVKALTDHLETTTGATPLYLTDI